MLLIQQVADGSSVVRGSAAVARNLTFNFSRRGHHVTGAGACLLYTSDAADE